MSYIYHKLTCGFSANRTLIPIHSRVVKDLSDFDGAWTMWESTDLSFPLLIHPHTHVDCIAGLIDDIAAKVYEAMAYHVTQANFNRRVRAVSAWSLQMTASAILSALRAAMDPMASHLRELYSEGLPYDITFPVNLVERTGI